MNNYYFHLEKQNIEELMLSEMKTKNNCFIHEKKSKIIIYKGFILDENSQSTIVCEVSFYKKKNTNKYLPRLKFRKLDKNLEEQKMSKKIIIDLNDGDKSSRFWILIDFLKKFKNLVDGGDFEKSYQIVKQDFILELESKSKEEKILEISKISDALNLSSSDIINALRLQDREKNLKEFDDFLNNKNYNGKSCFEIYKEKYDIKLSGDESVWHHFLEKNNWIIGLNLDIKFISDFLSEQKIGLENSEGRNSPKVDFLGQISNFTVLIELKTSKTEIFKKSRSNTSRANTWSFSSAFIDGISQCLGQKFSFDKSYESKHFIDKNNHRIDKLKLMTLDPKSIFIIGNRQQEFPLDNNQDNITKNETFERFRRNNKHIEIITFDELYERAKYIINHN